MNGNLWLSAFFGVKKLIFEKHFCNNESVIKMVISFLLIN